MVSRVLFLLNKVILQTKTFNLCQYLSSGVHQTFPHRSPGAHCKEDNLSKEKGSFSFSINITISTCMLKAPCTSLPQAPWRKKGCVVLCFFFFPFLSFSLSSQPLPLLPSLLISTYSFFPPFFLSLFIIPGCLMFFHIILGMCEYIKVDLAWAILCQLPAEHLESSVLHESDSEVTQTCPTLCDPMDCSLPGCLVHGIFQARIME